jgi:putative ABC transport system ATP-binding protein
MIVLNEITKTYHMGSQTVRALQGINLSITAGEFVAIIGASGSGKSTLMNIIGCLDAPDSGTYQLSGKDVSRLDDDAQACIRNREIGFIFQQFNLLPRTSAQKQVALPLLYQGVPAKTRLARARDALTLVGLGDRIDHRPDELSGGQQQRVAIARALVGNPSLLLADEPTGALDSHTTLEIFALLSELNAQGRTVVVITHDHDIARRAKRIVRISDGRIVSDQHNGA